MGLKSAGTVVGFCGLLCVAGGAWGFWGWPAAALVVGLPFATFYLWAEARDMWRGGGD